MVLAVQFFIPKATYLSNGYVFDFVTNVELTALSMLISPVIRVLICFNLMLPNYTFICILTI